MSKESEEDIAHTGEYDPEKDNVHTTSTSTTDNATPTVLTEEQTAALHEFKAKANLSAKDREDTALCRRFLVARQFNVDKAVEMYNGYRQWREQNNVDSVLQEGFKIPKDMWLHSFHGRDKLGRPIFIEKTGQIDVKHMKSKGYTIDDLVRAHINQQEYMALLAAEASKHDGKDIEQTLFICDLQGGGVFRHLNGQAQEFFSALAKLAQNYYPERLGKMIVVNCPRGFPMAWAFIKPFLDVKTQNKISVANSSASFKTLSEFIDPDYIPKIWGGNCDCEKLKCFTGPNPPPESAASCLRYH
eukprot:TRINITY_DN2239_c0_g1_i1.p1 TRINITY_DN2239_c0_g1~~TRINITY_DN2239_c0_g1_i1.p1  ORF type:complete len:326 (-),score=81.68 TRINITY_DN2239_c0_g1_i1:32-934(-)